jgi:acyl-CoA synthetase (NDP forming)
MREIDLARFFKASTVAIIGASENGTGASVYNNLKAMGFPKDNLYLVNPRRERVFDQTCYRSVSVLPISPDVASTKISQNCN